MVRGWLHEHNLRETGQDRNTINGLGCPALIFEKKDYQGRPHAMGGHSSLHTMLRDGGTGEGLKRSGLGRHGGGIMGKEIRRLSGCMSGGVDGCRQSEYIKRPYQ